MFLEKSATHIKKYLDKKCNRIKTRMRLASFLRKVQLVSRTVARFLRKVQLILKMLEVAHILTKSVIILKPRCDLRVS
jgi:hypothetical protein